MSKAYGLISRFSEDIDITVFREDLGQEASVPEFEALSRKKRQTKLDEIKETCRQYIQNTLAQQFEEAVQGTLAESRVEANVLSVVVDPGDPDGQSLLFWYPTVTAGRDEYIRPAVKIESGANLHRIFQPELGARAVADRALSVDCVAHARMFFDSPDLGLDRAVPGTFSLMPADEMIEDLRRDYSRMAGMIIGDAPEFDEVMGSIAALEEELNR